MKDIKFDDFIEKMKDFDVSALASAMSISAKIFGGKKPDKKMLNDASDKWVDFGVRDLAIFFSTMLKKDPDEYPEFKGKTVAEVMEMISNPKNKDKYEDSFYLFFFFSYKNCPPCLKVISVLNNLPPQFIVVGVIQSEELRDEPLIRKELGVTFRLISTNKLKKYIPPYWPTIVGVDQNRKIYFILPSVPDEKDYLAEFITKFYEIANPSF